MGMMNLYQKIVLGVGAGLLLYITFFNYPTRIAIVNNPDYVPSSGWPQIPQHISISVPDYALLILHIVVILIAIGIILVLLKSREKNK
jgi:hypothetical protein